MKTYNTTEEKKRFFQTQQILTSKDLWDFVKQCKENKNLVFRGVNEAKYMCYSSAQVRTELSLDQPSYISIISEAISQVRKSSLLMNYIHEYSCDETDFQILALMQHYGCGTPVLDYSSNIDSALFFATDRQGGKTQYRCQKDVSIDAFISVYYFDRRDPNHCSIQEFTARDSEKVNELDAEAAKVYGVQYKGISKQTMVSFENLPFEEMAKLNNGGLFAVLGHSNGIISFNVGGREIEYDINNERIEAQDGLFLFNSLSTTSYEEAACNWYSGIKNYCVNIHKSLEGEIKRYLKKNDITCEKIYPQTKESRSIIEELSKLPLDERLKPRPIVCKKECCFLRCLNNAMEFCKCFFGHKEDRYISSLPK